MNKLNGTHIQVVNIKAFTEKQLANLNKKIDHYTVEIQRLEKKKASVRKRLSSLTQ